APLPRKMSGLVAFRSSSNVAFVLTGSVPLGVARYCAGELGKGMPLYGLLGSGPVTHEPATSFGRLTCAARPGIESAVRSACRKSVPKFSWLVMTVLYCTAFR